MRSLLPTFVLKKPSTFLRPLLLDEESAEEKLRDRALVMGKITKYYLRKKLPATKFASVERALKILFTEFRIEQINIWYHKC